MSVIMKEEHLRIVKLWKRRVWKLIACLLLLVMVNVGMFWLVGLERSLIRESYLTVKSQFERVKVQQQLLQVLRKKALTVGQAMDIAEVLLDQNRVPTSLALAVIERESEFKAEAVSNEGARGLMQIMPKTFQIYSKYPDMQKYKDMHDPVLNVRIGVMYLGDLHDRYSDWRKVLRAYVAGPENVNVKKHDKYANAVLMLAKNWKNEF